jgi:hypothetical protein
MGDPAAEEYKKSLEQEISDDDTAAARLRLNQQAALMLSIKDVMPIVNSISPPVFNNFATVNIESAGHNSLTNALYRSKEQYNFFRNSNTKLLSSLLPSIKLYKVFYPQTAKGVAPTGFGAKTYTWRVPFDDIPIKYDNKTSEYVQESAEKAILEGGRLNGIGIKSFSYKYVGVNPGEANTNIEASLELYFQNIEDLTKIITINSKDSRFIPPIRGEEFNDYPFAYTDLISPSDAHRKDTKQILEGNRLQSIDYRIKVVCGYADVNKSYLAEIMPEKTSEEINELALAIETSKVALFLNPYSHELSFNEDGSITIKIQYQAAIDNILADINVLECDKTKYEDVIKLKKELADLTAQRDLQINEMKKNCLKLSDKERDKQAQDLQTQKEQEVFDKNNELDNLKNVLYSSIFKQLLSTDKIFLATFKPEMLGINSSGEVLENGEHIRLKSLKDMAGLVRIEKTTLENTPDAESSALYTGVDYVKTPRTFFGGKPDTEDKDTAGAAIAAESDPPDEGESAGGGNFLVRFVRFGDLFDIACNSINILPIVGDKPRFVLGDMKISIPIGLENASPNNPKDLTANFLDDAAHREYLNLADVPISFQMFNQFFMEKVVKPRLDSYPLLNFLSDVVTDIILPSVSPSVFGRSRNNAISNNVRYSFLSVALPTQDGNDIMTGKPVTAPFNGKIDNAKIIEITKKIKKSVDKTDTLNYIILYCSSVLPEAAYNNNGNLLKDEEAGMFHFRVGTDTGIVKKMSFSKTQNQFQREAKVAQAGNLQGGYLIENYDVNVDMFGNNIYRPGDIFYVEPLYYTGDQAREIQYRLGLGGYYSVIDTETSINENIFDTKVKAVLVGRISRDGKVEDVSGNGGC